ncbi:MAG: potassium channel protein [Pseudomonadota bacterium]|jgi:inward rectifier potassium channel|nr:potassium channel protein [Xanthomonadaceae bacterium]MDE2247761.1 potassium channel protein [Xanthomonadaceae bacterium]MDE3210985.1 potassium channel protein [Pseudomonadota bacterium]
MEIGGRRFVSEGLSERLWDDIYHRALTVSWPVFFGVATGIFLLLNTVFALLYQLSAHSIANQFPRGFAGAFFFSVETLATVGYGDMHPQTVYAHLVSTLEIILGMGGIATVTGLIFARFSRPRARIIFADHPIVGPIEGRPTLMIRAANTRQNVIAQASAQLYLVHLVTTSEGFRFRRVEDLRLVRQRHPLFMLSWTLMHVIDESSPLHGESAESLERGESMFLLTIEGTDETTAQTMLARREWSHRAVRWNHRYIDLVRGGDDDTRVIDYSVFHQVLPLDANPYPP